MVWVKRKVYHEGHEGHEEVKGKGKEEPCLSMGRIDGASIVASYSCFEERYIRKMVYALWEEMRNIGCQ